MDEKIKIEKIPFDIKILIIGGVLTLLILFFQVYEHKRVRKAQTNDAGIILVNKIKAKLEVVEDITDFLKGISIARGGEVSREEFNKVSKFLYSLYQDNEIRGIFYLKGGKIEYVYPIEGNIGTIGIDILKQADRKEDAFLAIEKKQNVLSGPYDLYQGKKGLIIRNPIFISKKEGEKFIGFSVIVIKFPSFINNIVLDELKNYNYEISTFINGEKKRIASKGKLTEKSKIFKAEILNSVWEITLEPKINFLGIRMIVLVGGSLAILTLLLSNLSYRYKEKKILLEDLELERKLLILALENSNIVIFIYNDETKKISFINKRNFIEEYEGGSEVSAENLEEGLVIEEGKEELIKIFSQIKGGKKSATCIVKKRSKKYGDIWEKVTLLNPFSNKYGMRKIIGVVENINFSEVGGIDDR